MSHHRVVYGIQPVREVLRAHGSKAGPIWIAEPPNPKHEGLARLAEKHGVVRRKSSRAELDRMTKGAMHQGVLIEAPDLRVHDEDAVIDAFESDPNALAIYLDCGEEDEYKFDDQARYLDGILDGRGVEHDFEIAPGHHLFDFWKARLPKSLAFFDAKLARR